MAIPNIWVTRLNPGGTTENAPKGAVPKKVRTSWAQCLFSLSMAYQVLMQMQTAIFYPD